MDKTKEIPKNLLVAGALVIALLFIVAVAVTWKAPAAPPTGPAAPVACNNDGTCGAGETKENCPNDCVPSGVLSAARSVDSATYGDTTPTIIMKMSSPTGVQSCSSGPTDASKWDCRVIEPGATETDVLCTLQNYFYDGTYMLRMFCKDNNGNDLPPETMDNIYVCASDAGCGRWYNNQNRTGGTQ